MECRKGGKALQSARRACSLLSMRSAAEALTQSPTMCSKCGEHPKAVRPSGQRLKWCIPCIRESGRATVGLSSIPAQRGKKGTRSPRRKGSIDNSAVVGQGSDVGHATCGARTRSGGLCSKAAGYGTDHLGAGNCKFHGGSTTSGRISAVRAQGQMQAVHLGAPIDIDPMSALLWCVRIAAGEVAYFTLQVNLLTDGDAVGHPESVKERPLSYGKDGDSPSQTVYETTYGTPTLNIYISARQSALDRLAKYAKMAVDAGVAERQVKLAEEWGETIGRIIGNILDGLRLTPKQQRKAPELVRQHMAAIEQGEPV